MRALILEIPQIQPPSLAILIESISFLHVCFIKRATIKHKVAHLLAFKQISTDTDKQRSRLNSTRKCGGGEGKEGAVCSDLQEGEHKADGEVGQPVEATGHSVRSRSVGLLKQLCGDQEGNTGCTQERRKLVFKK